MLRFYDKLQRLNKYDKRTSGADFFDRGEEDKRNEKRFHDFVISYIFWGIW